MAAVVGVSMVVVFLLGFAVWAALIHQIRERRRLYERLRLALEVENKSFDAMLGTATKFSETLLNNARLLDSLAERLEAKGRRLEPLEERLPQSWD